MSVFKKQTLLTINAETNYDDLASASVTRILYTKPNGRTTGFWDATVSGTTLVYNVQEGDLDVDGTWSFQSYIEVGGLKGYGEIVERLIKKPLS
jgi:hypothetical protein